MLVNKKFDVIAITGIHNKNFEQLKKQFVKNNNIQILNFCSIMRGRLIEFK